MVASSFWVDSDESIDTDIGEVAVITSVVGVISKWVVVSVVVSGWHGEHFERTGHLSNGSVGHVIGGGHVVRWGDGGNGGHVIGCGGGHIVRGQTSGGGGGHIAGGQLIGCGGGHVAWG